MPDDTDDNNSFLEMELEALKSIYIDELNIENNDIGKPERISINLVPATADNVDEQYVRMTLIFNLSEKYPESLPQINIRNPRGLSDEMLNRMTENLYSIAEEKKGNSMLYELIEAAKEHLTTENRPSGQCAICLYGFSDTDVFTRTECFHYFHSHCLARYSQYVLKCDDNQSSNEAVSEIPKKELLCPMCRVPIMFCDAEDYPPPSSAEEDTFAMNQELCELQRKMADLYQKQIEKGGIIDIEAEKNRYLLEISNVPTSPTSANTMEKPNLDSKSTNSEIMESKSQESKVLNLKSTTPNGSPVPNNERAQNNTKPVTKQKYRRPEERNRPDRRNNRYDQRYDTYANEKAHTYSHDADDNNERHQTRPYRKSKKNFDFPQKHFLSKEENHNSQPLLDKKESENLEAKISTEPDSEASRPESPEFSATAKSFRTGYSNGRRNNRKPRNAGYSSRENSSKDRVETQSNNDTYNSYDKQSTTQNSNRQAPNRQNHRHSYQTNRKYYRGEDEGNFSHLQQQPQIEKSDGYYPKSNRYNSRGSRFNDNRKFNHQESAQNNPENLPKNSIGNAKQFKESEPSDKSDLGANSECNVPNRVRKNMQSSGSRYRSNNYQEADSQYGESDMHNKRETGYSRNTHSNYSGHQRNRRNFQYNSHPRYNQASQHSELAQVGIDKKGPTASETRYCNPSSGDTQQEKTSHVIQPPVPMIPEPYSKKSPVMAMGNDSPLIVPDLHNSCNFPMLHPRTMLPPPPGFANPMKKVIYGLSAANPPPGFHRS